MIWVFGDAKAVGYGKEIFEVRGCSEQEQFFYTTSACKTHKPADEIY